MSGFTEEISKFFEATSSLIAEVRNFSEDGLRASFYKERLQVHIEICSVILTHLNMQQQPCLDQVALSFQDFQFNSIVVNSIVVSSLLFK
jgi:hypothetical protein